MTRSGAVYNDSLYGTAPDTGDSRMTANIIAMAAPSRQPVVILFAETRGFTRTSAILEPAAVSGQVMAFFDMVSAVVERSGGSVQNLLNDTLMASFSGAERARTAVEAAQQIQRDFSDLEESWVQEFGIRAAVAMGLHAGEVVIAHRGNTAPMVIGDTVSIALRLLHRARAGEFVLSAPVLDALGDNHALVDAESLPPLLIPRREAIALFGVLRDTRLDFT